MNSISSHDEDADKGFPRLDPSPEDRFVSLYLEDRSDVYRDLIKVQDDAWNNPQATAYFGRQRRTADDPTARQQRVFDNMMCNIGDEMEEKSGGALSLPRSNARVLDLCMAPGNYTASTLRYSPYAVVRALTLPLHLGGHPVASRYSRQRHPSVRVWYGDITMLHIEFGVTEVPQDHPDFSNFSDKRLWHGKRFDLVFCDGQALRTHEPHIADYRRKVEAARLAVSQLILAMQRIESGGTLIMLLHNVQSYKTIKILSIFDKVAEIRLFKPVSGHKKRGSFYLIAKNVQPGHPEAVAAVNGWKKIWKDLTFPILGPDGHPEPLKVTDESELEMELSKLLDNFGERIIELGEPIWQIQKEALATANWRIPDTESGRVDTGEASTAATDNAAAAAAHNSEDVNDDGDLDDVATVPVLGQLSE